MLIMLCGFFFTNKLWAACYAPSGTQNITITLPSTLVVARDVPSGTVVWESGWRVGVYVNNIYCDAPGAWTMAYLTSTVSSRGLATGFTDVYNTTIPGVGIRIYYCKASCSGTAVSGAYNHRAMTTSAGPYESDIGGGPFISQPGYFVQLVKIAATVGTGTLTYSGVGAVAYYDVARSSQLTLTGTTAGKSSACTVNNNSVTVTLPTVQLRSFTSGSTSSSDANAVKEFQINLVCGQNINVYYRIDGTTATTNVLANTTGTGRATGVGVQLFKGTAGSSVVQPLNALGTLGAPITTVDNQAVNIPLTAKYYMTVPLLSSMTVGTVDTTATFTLSYQ
ncbi:hypothetical protein IV04_01200 [Serratia sp. Ag1]|nr:hypothetical protein JV45_05575 [Serratia sp. Ag2]KFL00629.1 hypothetical protein IV04_01200 [Serratia sp. Ag1]